MGEASAKIVITGVVQGVWFRAYTKEQADRLGLKGYVRNLPTGQVEAVFAGSKGAVENAIAWCHDGSPSARVDKVDVVWEDSGEDFKDFSVRY
ncbi:MAG: acylphosphatase [Desulfarculaceae bacterium]|jgi:acylphosphatase